MGIGGFLCRVWDEASLLPAALQAGAAQPGGDALLAQKIVPAEDKALGFF